MDDAPEQDFEWGAQTKPKANLRKHGIAFEAARRVEEMAKARRVPRVKTLRRAHLD